MTDPRQSAAMALARIAHRGQTDRADEDYFSGHLTRVGESLTPALMRAAGYLHDILEDTDITEDELLDLGIDAHVVVIVEIVTRRGDETYFEFIARILDSWEPDAILLKIADIEDHLRDTTRLSDSMVTRYTKALDILREE